MVAKVSFCSLPEQLEVVGEKGFTQFTLVGEAAVERTLTNLSGTGNFLHAGLIEPPFSMGYVNNEKGEDIGGERSRTDLPPRRRTRLFLSYKRLWRYLNCLADEPNC